MFASGIIPRIHGKMNPFQVQVGNRTYDVSELQKAIPQFEETIAKKDGQLKQAQMAMDANAKRITELETEVRALQVTFGLSFRRLDYRENVTS